MHESCSECKHYNDMGVDPQSLKTLAECRLDPPTVAFIPAQTQQGIQVTKVCGFPNLSPDSIQCGQFEKRAKLAAVKNKEG